MSQHNNTPLHKRQVKDTKNKGKRHVADTSIEAWHIINEREQPQKEKAKVYAIIDKIQPVTSRKLSEVLKIERTNITRSLNDLVKAGKLKIARKAKCPVTGMTVSHYSKIDWEPKESGQ